MVQRADDGHFLVLVGAGGDDDGAVVDQRRQAAELALVIGQGFAGQLQVHLTVDAGAQQRQPVGAGLILRPDMSETGHQGAGHAGGLLPALGGLVGDAGADQGQGHAALTGRRQQVGPQLALDKDADGRPPVIEEGGDGAGAVDRGELVNDARGQALGQNLRRGQGPGGDQNRHVGAVLSDTLGQGQDGQGLADADAVNPDQRPVRARHTGQTQAFIDPLRVLLALLDAGVEQARGQGLHQPGQQAIGDQGGAEDHG
ncbi:hypothetical protein D3C80_909860 [compost metagenome]